MKIRGFFLFLFHKLLKSKVQRPFLVLHGVLENPGGSEREFYGFRDPLDPSPQERQEPEPPGMLMQRSLGRAGKRDPREEDPKGFVGVEGLGGVPTDPRDLRDLGIPKASRIWESQKGSRRSQGFGNPKGDPGDLRDSRIPKGIQEISGIWES